MYLKYLWIFDSGASSHMVNCREYFQESTRQIILVSGGVIYTQGYGRIRLKNFYFLTSHNV